MNVDEPFLSNSVGAVCRLIFNRGIPPSVIMDDVIGGRQIEACAPAFNDKIKIGNSLF